jgi:hypothetical protein
MVSQRISRRNLLRSLGVSTTSLVVGSSSVAAQEARSDKVRTFDVGDLPESIAYLSDPKRRQAEAWEVAKTIHSAEQEVSDELGQYSPDDIESAISTTSDGRTDLRSFSRLVEVLHENDLAGIIDESLLDSIGDRADRVVRYAPLLGSVNNVLDKAEAFATKLAGDRRDEYVNFVLSIACLCLEAGLMWVGAPYKLAWKGTNKIFFAQSGTLFRLGRYGGDRFVAFFMSEVHWEIREAIYDEINTERAKWVADQVNSQREIPDYTSLREDAESIIQNRPKFSVKDFNTYEFAKEYTDEAVNIGSDILGEFVELVPEDRENTATSESSSLVLNSNIDWQ